MALGHLRLPLSLIFSLLFFSIQFSNALYPTQLIYQFPNKTFVENLAIRPDGSILTTFFTAPEVYLIQPSSTNPNPQLIHTFNGSTSVEAITEVSPDSFLVGVCSFSGTQPLPGSSSLWHITFPRRRGNGNGTTKPRVTLAIKMPNVSTPSGLVSLSKTKFLMSDTIQGVLYLVDLNTSTATIAITDPLFKPTAKLPSGINGIKLRGSTLYFTNVAQSIFGRVPIDLRTGQARGPASVIAHALYPSAGYDDFALVRGDAYVANSVGNFIERIDLGSGRQSVVAGDINSTEVAQPTSAALGRDGTLFVTTGGGLLAPVNGDEVVGGQVVAVELGGY